MPSAVCCRFSSIGDGTYSYIIILPKSFSIKITISLRKYFFSHVPAYIGSFDHSIVLSPPVSGKVRCKYLCRKVRCRIGYPFVDDVQAIPMHRKSVCIKRAFCRINFKCIWCDRTKGRLIVLKLSTDFEVYRLVFSQLCKYFCIEINHIDR